MIIYLDRDEVPNLEDIPSPVLWHLIRKAEGANGRFLRLDRYYRGQHDNLRRQPEADEVLVAVNYAKYVVDIAQGYYLGEPVKYDTNETHEAEDGPQSGATASGIPQHQTEKSSPQNGTQAASAVKEGQRIDLSPPAGRLRPAAHQRSGQPSKKTKSKPPRWGLPLVAVKRVRF